MKFLENQFSSSDQGSFPHGSMEPPEREAIMDFLLLAAYIDRHLSLSESNAFDDATESLGWDSQTGPSIYINSATNRARNVRSSEAAKAELVDFIAGRLTSIGSKECALSLLNHLLMSDGKPEDEATFFKQVEAAFVA